MDIDAIPINVDGCSSKKGNNLYMVLVTFCAASSAVDFQKWKRTNYG